jgi:hypothetical protein
MKTHPFVPNRPALLAVPLLLLGVAAAGCIHTEETVTRDEPRVKVEFENETAGRVFYEALSRYNGSHSRRESSAEVEIPLVFGHKTRTVRGPNTDFNEAVQRADTNKDGRITETEARIYSDAVR